MKLKYNNRKSVDLFEWDRFIEEIYCRPYSFQQQNGCRERGVENFTIPLYCESEDNFPTSIPFKVNGEEMGVNFETWSTVNVDEINSNFKDGDEYDAGLFWQRNFYPDFYVLLNDLYKRGLIEEGDYQINIDW